MKSLVSSKMEKIKHLIKKKVEPDTVLWNCLAAAYGLLQFQSKEERAQKKISKYLENLKPEQELKVIFGGHWYDTDEWLILSEDEQDIKQPLKFLNESVDVIFTEHVIEHVDFLDAVMFMKESIRILKKGGVFRIVCPTIERLISVKLNDENGKRYVQNCLIGVWSDENKLLNELRLNGIFESPKTFLLNSIFTKHGHRFIWSRELMVKVLKAIGFHQVSERKVGEGINKEYCIERRRRGLYLGHDWKVDRSANVVYDPEGEIIEAIK
jgi:predicted SAM-dependent methyltransferase